jgi:hypothetical protein
MDEARSGGAGCQSAQPECGGIMDIAVLLGVFWSQTVIQNWNVCSGLDIEDFGKMWWIISGQSYNDVEALRLHARRSSQIHLKTALQLSP